MSVVDDSFDHPLLMEEHASMCLAGGIEQMGFQCGQVWGAALAAGARAYQLYGPGAQAEAAALGASQKLVQAFRSSYRAVNCSDLIQMDWKKPNSKEILKFFVKGGPARCFAMTAGYARTVRRTLDAEFATNPRADDFSTASAPVSCAAELARRMGASDLQVVMAAGLAGGIGLSGAGCGALGAALWLLATRKAGEGSVEFNTPEAMEIIDRFVESTEVRFECAEITGRTFRDAREHSEYVRCGGCAAVMDALAKTSG